MKEDFENFEKPHLSEKLIGTIRKFNEDKKNGLKEDFEITLGKLESFLFEHFAKEAFDILEKCEQGELDFLIKEVYYTAGLKRKDWKISKNRLSRSFFSVDDTKQIMSNIKNFLEVKGYNSSELKQRKEVNPIPTASEILMGCYSEQIEAHTRDSVRILREKGYNTVQSGFHGHLTGSQFFDIYFRKPLPEFDAEVMKKFEEEYLVKVREEDMTDKYESHLYVIFDPINHSKSLKEWSECLIEYAKIAPDTGEPNNFSPKGETVSFAFKALQDFPIEEILKTANEEEEVLIRKLYKCKTKEGVRALVESS